MTLTVPENLQTSRDFLAGTISDLVADFLYYDRKEDEQLPRGEIEKMIGNNEVTIDEIVELFRSELEKSITT